MFLLVVLKLTLDILVLTIKSKKKALSVLNGSLSYIDEEGHSVFNIYKEVHLKKSWGNFELNSVLICTITF